MSKEKDNLLQDGFGRIIRYLRLSVTDRCDLRCIYCMAEKMTFLPKKDILSLEELECIAQNFVRRGVTKIRLTGGEPLLRRGMGGLIKKLGKLVENKKLSELTLTTNGTALARYASLLVDSGVKRINVSLDTLKEDVFHRLTRGGDINQVMEGLAEAKKVGLAVKINRVALRGINDEDLPDMIAWCGDENFDLTLIELMPMSDTGYSRALHYMPLDELEQSLQEHYHVTPLAYKTGGPARYVFLKEAGLRLGLITPLTGNFCANCNRVRVTATGRLYLCLGQEHHVDLRKVMRQQGIDALGDAIKYGISIKPEGHDFAVVPSCQKDGILAMAGEMKRHMSQTGG